MQLSRNALIGLSLLCVLCAVGLGLVVRDVVLQAGASSGTATVSMIAAIGALIGTFAVLVKTMRSES